MIFQKKPIAIGQPIEEKTITVIVREIYGRAVAYPVCDTARTLATIAGTRTLTQRTIDQAKALGYRVIVTRPVLPFEL